MPQPHRLLLLDLLSSGPLSCTVDGHLDVDWDLFLEEVDDHGLSGLAFCQLRTRPDGVPEPVLARLEDRFRSTSTRFMFMRARLIAILQALERDDIQALPFKGPALALTYYDVPSARKTGDLDILVRTTDFERARPCLAKKDFRLAEELPVVERAPYQSNHDTYSDGEILVEVHNKIGITDYRALEPPEEWWRRARTIDLGGYRARTFGHEEALLVSLVHGCKHLWRQFFWIADIRLLLRSSALDWRRVQHMAEAHRCWNRMRFGLQLVHSLTGAPAPEPGQGPLPPGFETHLWARRRGAGAAVREFLTQSRLHDSRSERGGYLLRAIFGPTQQDWLWIQLPRQWYWLYRPLRPLRLFFRYLAGGRE